jgi:hypothetical protein
MPIEEKKVPLEFDFRSNMGEDDATFYSIKYMADDRSHPIIVKHNGADMSFPLNFFEEVVTFLRSKGVIKNQVNIRGEQIKARKPKMFNSDLILPIPEVEKSGEQGDEESSDVPKIEAVPFASFEVAPTQDVEIEPVVTEQPKAPSEIINRPVIRTRINDSDPLSAEKEAAEIRGKGGSGDKKTIKRA